MRNSLRTIACFVLLIAGVAIWGWLFHFTGISRAQEVAIALIALVCLIPQARRSITQLFVRLAHPSPRRRAQVTLVIWLASTAFLIFTAFDQHRPTYPRSHDEQSYLLQMRMLSQGKLWTKSPALPDFFETLYVLVQPVYAPIYFPGAALIYVWEIWLNTPHWVGPVILAGGCIALLFRIASELLDDAVLGFLTSMYLLGLLWFRYLSILVLSHLVIIFLGLLLVWAYLRWRQKRSMIWALLMGIILGWAAITRPLDGACYALPVAIAMLWHLREMKTRKIALTIALILVGATPFAGLQAIFNHGVTGDWTKSPYNYYIEHFSPGMQYATGHFDPNFHPTFKLPQQQLMYEQFLRPAIENASHQHFGGWFDWKLRQLFTGDTPTRFLIVLIPMSLLGLWRRERWILWGMFPLYLIGYGYFPFMLGQYQPIAGPAVALLAMIGFQEMTKAAGPLRNYLRGAGVLALLVLCLFNIYEIYGNGDDGIFNPFMRMVAREMPKVVKPPAVVLFTFDPLRDSIHENAVYNINSVDIDKSPVIRANDLGPRDRELYAYYASRQPQRMFYLFNRAEATIYPLGTAKELAEKYPIHR